MNARALRQRRKRIGSLGGGEGTIPAPVGDRAWDSQWFENFFSSFVFYFFFLWMFLYLALSGLARQRANHSPGHGVPVPTTMEGRRKGGG